MGKGRYLKSAERACAGKAKFDSAQEAERTADWRFGSYLCPVCHKYHLTSSARPATEPIPEAPKPKEPGPRLGDLDWSRALDPQPKSRRAPKPPKPAKPAPPPAREARCLGAPDAKGRIPLLIEGQIVKSAPVKDPRMLPRLERDAKVRVDDGHPPRILWIEM